MQQKLMTKAPEVDCFLKESLFLCKLQSLTGSQPMASGCGRMNSHQPVESKQGKKNVYPQS